MTEVSSTITLKMSSVEGATLDQAEDLLRKMIRESTSRQNAGLKANMTVDCTSRTKFSNAAARDLVLPIPSTKIRLNKFNVDEMDKSEVRRILASYQKRLVLAKFLRSKKWGATLDECKKALGWIDLHLYENVLKSRKIPTFPRIKSAVIPLSKSATQFCDLKYSNSKVVLENFTLWDRRVDLFFELPAKLINLHPNLEKITRPTIRIDADKVVFDFVLRESVEREPIVSTSTLSVDLGVIKAFSAVRVHSDGRYSEEFTPSVFTDRQSRAAEKLGLEIRRVREKNKSRELLGVQNKEAIAQEKTLILKLQRVNEALDWSVAADILSHSKSGEQITIENLKFNTGGSIGVRRFRHSSVSSKLEHASNRRGKNVKRVSAAYSSQTCPKCQTRNKPDSDRFMHCECGWYADRDFTAAVVLGQRGLKIKKLSSKKNEPTPKRPRNSARKRRILPYKSTAWTAFTGASPAEATGKSIKLSATSVTDSIQSVARLASFSSKALDDCPALLKKIS